MLRVQSVPDCDGTKRDMLIEFKFYAFQNKIINRNNFSNVWIIIGKLFLMTNKNIF